MTILILSDNHAADDEGLEVNGIARRIHHYVVSLREAGKKSTWSNLLFVPNMITGRFRIRGMQQLE